MTTQQPDLTEIVPLAVLWDEIFDRARREETVDGLMEQLKNLPSTQATQVRIFQCRWHLASAENNLKEKQQIISEISLMRDCLLARGYHLGMVVESSLTENLTKVIRRYTMERKKFPIARTMEDLEGLGRYALCLAGAYISLGNEKAARDELVLVERYYGPMGHKGMNVRLKYQDLRLSFVSGKHLKVHNEAPAFIARAAKVNAALCGCVVDYLFYSDLLIGKRRNHIHPRECFNLFYQPETQIPLNMRARPEFIQVLTTFQKTIQLVDTLHLQFPFFRRNTEKYQKMREGLLQDVQHTAEQVVAEEFGEFLVALCVGVAQAFVGDPEGLNKLNNLNPPVMRKSLILNLLRATCLLEAKILLPEEPITLEMAQARKLLKRIPQLGVPAQGFLLHWMHHLCPHVLKMYHTLHQDERAAKMLEGVLIIGAEECEVHNKPDVRVVYYPRNLMTEDVVSIMSGCHLHHNEYMLAKEHRTFMQDNGLRRAVFTSLISEFLDREPEESGNAI